MGNFPLTAVDVVVIVVLLGSAGFAFLRGFVHEVLAILAWVGAGLAALYGFRHVQPFFRDQIGTIWAADAAAGASLFLVTLLLLSILTRAVSDRVRKSALNSVDSSLGFVFGLARGALLLCLAYLAVAWMMAPEAPPAWLANAKSQPWLERGAGLLQAMAPEGMGAAEATTRQMSDEARELQRTEETFRKFVAPQPAEPAPGGPAQGYDKDSRSQLERLIQSNQ
ncbi:CvpA family protein [Magnetospirillum sp. UT-4]|uniref:CvpA family protein n=1 Tax=Magnetospirillum sp. UT-4 TaxID=2681467 RepID=UPI001383031D|nr:CvpA family protein [Magnetospirillum sp. UT-4]CAA7623137.1 conserved membrane hypothetical protein [Magnetospirillum sp. UT-4]